ncbi:type I inositol polyphosphate 5-phosphatase 4-like [Silene latifolia]|uniref:type I inositol polyphosphate 5-phosphatase 4-like n=1 Tax=Silene latifolia TaxID=37657 RepID=UPI003D76BED5
MKILWPKTLVKKWFNIKEKVEEFDADSVFYGGSDEYWSYNNSTIKKCKTETSSIRSNSDHFRQETDVLNYRIFVATWNVAGNSPPSHLDLEEWLHNSPPADIYVLGFQEIVPLNAGNVLGNEDNGPARKWLALIRRTLNNLPDSKIVLDAKYEGSTGQKDSDFLDIPLEKSEIRRGQSRYSLVASKQMVGIFLTVWIKSDLRDNVQNTRISCVGRGLMGYLGNKGSISISMSLHQTSFCFVCSHLTSGQKEGDELRRNSDVMEILRKTRFYQCDMYSPQTILSHDRVIWLGDLNYRVSLSYPFAKALIELKNWKVLLENDQLRIEQRRGRVFEGWKEGNICFPPTYKYTKNSDIYAGSDVQKQKRRTPAWCDRILWYGNGLHQLSYVRGESRFSDHRPVYSVFLAEVESSHRDRFRKSWSYSSARVEVEELLPHSRG